MGLFDGFRSMGPRLQQQGYNSPWTYLRDIAQQAGQSDGNLTGYITPKPPYPISPEQLAERRQTPSYTPGYTPPGGIGQGYQTTGGGALPPGWLSNPLPPDKYNLAPGQSGAAYNIGGGRTLYTGGAQSPTSLAQGNRRRMKSQLDQMRGRMNVQYDPSQFSSQLNDYLNNRVMGWGSMKPDYRNRFLNRLVGFRELESARRAASPEYAQLAQQYAAAPRGIIR